MLGQLGSNLFSNGLFNRLNNGAFNNPVFRGLGHKYGQEKQAENETKETQNTTNTDTVESAGQTPATTTDASNTADSEETTQTTPVSMMDEFKQQLNDTLMGSLGLNDLSSMGNLNELFGSAMSGNSFSAMRISAQFEMNFQSVMAVAGENGMQMQSVNFSLKASFEFLGATSGVGSSFNPFATDDTEEGSSTDPLSKLKDLFSPDKTAQRILDFALSFFPNSQQYSDGGDTQDSRQSFADVMTAAVQKGFDQAMGILGNVPDETADEIDQTHQKVFNGFDDFVQNGYDWSNNNYSTIQSYSSSFEMNYSSTSIYYSNDELGSIFGNQQAIAQDNSYEADAAEEVEASTATQSATGTTEQGSATETEQDSQTTTDATV